ncbi:MAG: aminotransferase class I/II-fold pyridoxal phosphate-dependent enzyme, partial [Selenomonadaceae bacterium]
SFVFSTALSAPVIAAGAAALSVLRREPERVSQLQRKAELVKKILLQGGVQLLPSDTPILPILSGSAERALAFSKRLEERGLLVSAIRPPTVPVGQSRLRLTVTDAHSEADLQRAAQIVIEAQKEL